MMWWPGTLSQTGWQGYAVTRLIQCSHCPEPLWEPRGASEHCCHEPESRSAQATRTSSSQEPGDNPMVILSHDEPVFQKKRYLQPQNWRTAVGCKAQALGVLFWEKGGTDRTCCCQRVMHLSWLTQPLIISEDSWDPFPPWKAGFTVTYRGRNRFSYVIPRVIMPVFTTQKNFPWKQKMKCKLLRG